MKLLNKIRIVGAGNVANQLAISLAENGFPIDLIYNRTLSKAQSIAKKINAKASNEWIDLNDSTLIICCTSDDSLHELIPKLSKIAPTVSVSGAQNSMKIPHEKAVGVFYPLQTFSAEHLVDWNSTPIFIEAIDPELLEALKVLGNKISKTVVELNYEQRQHLHIAAVFANNFTNHLLDLSETYLEQHQLKKEWMLPLVEETFRKIKVNGAFQAQTGPAKRNDTSTLQQHTSMLEGQLKTLYEQITASIQHRFLNNEKL